MFCLTNLRPNAATTAQLRSRAVPAALSGRCDAGRRRTLSYTAAGPATRWISRPTALPPSSTTTLSSRSLPRSREVHTTAALRKKGKGKEQQKTPDAFFESAPPPAAEDEADHPSHAQADPNSPFEMKDVEEAYDRVSKRSEERLKDLRQGGRFSPDAIGRVPIQLDKSSGGAATTPLSQLGLVDARSGGGRVVQITLFEASHRKAVVAALEASEQFNQQPQPDADDPTILTLKVESQTLEDQLRLAREICHQWRDGLRRVTSARQKKHAAWRKKKVDGAAIVGPDDVVRLDKEVQKLQDRRMKLVDAAEKTAQQALARNHGNKF